MLGVKSFFLAAPTPISLSQPSKSSSLNSNSLSPSFTVTSSSSDDQKSVIPRIFSLFEKLRTINHPNLCDYIDVFHSSHARIFLISEHWEQDILCLFSSVPHDDHETFEKTLRSAAFSIVKALSCLAENGITHRNLKTSNCRITPAGNIKLVDWGMYFITDSQSSVPFFIGYSHPFHTKTTAVTFVADQQITQQNSCLYCS